MDLAPLPFTSFIAMIMVLSSARTSKGTPKVIDARGKGVSRDAHNGIAFAKFKAHKFSYLNITSLGSDSVLNGSECGLACVNIPSCFSFNLAAFYDVNRKILCELLPSDIYNNSDKFVGSKFFHHFSIGSPCSSWPCQNNGKCITDYEKNSYVCHCVTGFTGKHCQTNINECESSPCVNNGTCTDLVNGFNCRCPLAFDGDRCEKPQKGHFSNLSAIIFGKASYQSHLHQFLTPAVGSNPQWVLCYRASTHGWAASTFHSRCDGKNHTVTIVKKGQYVFGGYTDIPWDSSGGYSYTSNAFIFSLRNKEGLAPFKSNVTRPQNAIYRISLRGPTFGGGYDIYIADNANSNTNSHTDFGSSYSVPSGVQSRGTILAGTYTFTPDDWEVFYLG